MQVQHCACFCAESVALHNQALHSTQGTGREQPSGQELLRPGGSSGGSLGAAARDTLGPKNMPHSPCKGRTPKARLVLATCAQPRCLQALLQSLVGKAQFFGSCTNDSGQVLGRPCPVPARSGQTLSGRS